MRPLQNHLPLDRHLTTQAGLCTPQYLLNTPCNSEDSCCGAWAMCASPWHACCNRSYSLCMAAVFADASLAINSRYMCVSAQGNHVLGRNWVGPAGLLGNATRPA
jgi:hypothetical protein